MLHQVASGVEDEHHDWSLTSREEATEQGKRADARAAQIKQIIPEEMWREVVKNVDEL